MKDIWQVVVKHNLSKSRSSDDVIFLKLWMGRFRRPAMSIVCGVDGKLREEKPSQPRDCLIPGLESQDTALCDETAVLLSLNIQRYLQF